MSFVNQTPSERVALVGIINPSSQAAGASSSGWVDTAKFRRLMALITTGALGASATVDAKLQQATSSSGAGAKDITGAAITQLVKASNDNDQAVISVDTANLDTTNAFRYVRLTITVATAASITAGHVFGLDPFNGPASDNQLATVVQTVNA